MMFKVHLSLLLVLMIPTWALAGPIEWSYRSQVVYDEDYGSNFTVLLNPGGTISAHPEEMSFAPLFNSHGVSRPVPGEYEVEYSFDIKVTLTDVASSEAAELTFHGGYQSLWSYQPGDDPNVWRWDSESSIFGSFWYQQKVILRNNRYWVRAYGGDHGQFPFGELSVVSIPLPEPGTLPLVGVGIASVTAALSRRRGKAST